MKRDFGGQLLRWVSEQGSGKWPALSAVISYLRTSCQSQFRRLGHDPAHYRPSEVAASLAALGHIDIDWTRGEWSVAKPTMNVVPGLGLCVVMTGSRTTLLEQRLKEASNTPKVYPFEVPQFPMPSASFLKCSNIETVKEVAKRFHADIVFDPSSSLVNRMCRLDELPLARVGEPRLEDAMKYTPGETYEWTYAKSFDDGLFRIDHTGRVVFRRRVTIGGEVHWFEVDRATGQLLELHRMGISIMRFTRTAADGSGALSVARGVSLPIGVERALTLCSGVIAEHHGQDRIYFNVNEGLADRVMDITLQSRTT